MTLTEPPAAFIVCAAAVCRWCAADIEQHRQLGWLHVKAFYLCPLQANVSEDLKTAEPQP